MSILNKLASSINRKDEEPNIELAKQLVSGNNTKHVSELVENLLHKNKDIQNDCIKVLYEIGERKPDLIAKYANNFIALLDNKNNRLQWGAMTALNTITKLKPELIYAALPKIIAAATNGSVITKDNAVKILVELCSLKEYSESAFILLNEQLLNSPANQLPMYAELAVPIITTKNRTLFIKTLTSRLNDIAKDTKKKRVEKVIKKIS